MSSPKLPYQFLGSTGVKVTSLCLGTMTFGQAGIGLHDKSVIRPGQSNEEESHEILDQFVAAGGNFIDTADVYQSGLSETYIGSWLAKHPELRKKIIIATKMCAPMDYADPNSGGLSRHHIMQAVEDSLKRLQTDYIDLYQTHMWDCGTDIEDTLHALNDLVKTGKVHYIGVSNVTGWQLQKIVETNKKFGYPQIVSLQVQYNLLCRETEWELVQVCRREKISLLPWSALKGGMLTGKYTRGTVPTDPTSSRVAWVEADPNRSMESQPSYSQYANDDKYWALIDTMKEIAKKHNATVAQIAIAWLLKQPTVTSVVLGARTKQQLADNLASVNVDLTDEEVKLLNEKSDIPMLYPYVLIDRMNKFLQRC
ncbi:1-deoxyxylulose-5-phosphate synthase YajO-like [Dysidea avara]|uniref:1-deoxyxylulose-5-phosphate synthase YajO-like n=1 Tax=Dysidea avara TaxID=196820 RepID=UPI00332C26CC